MMERLIVYAVVALAAAWLGRTAWRSARPGAKKPACPGCPAGTPPAARMGPK